MSLISAFCVEMRHYLVDVGRALCGNIQLGEVVVVRRRLLLLARLRCRRRDRLLNSDADQAAGIIAPGNPDSRASRARGGRRGPSNELVADCCMFAAHVRLTSSRRS